MAHTGKEFRNPDGIALAVACRVLSTNCTEFRQLMNGKLKMTTALNSMALPFHQSSVKEGDLDKRFTSGLPTTKRVTLRLVAQTLEFKKH